MVRRLPVFLLRSSLSFVWAVGLFVFLFNGGIQAQPPSWLVEPSNFQYNANVTAIFFLDDVVNEDTSNI
ncbi:MAG: hypothetical protein HYZ34_12745, partial [Ignavibacteriae bacterium]|nr:hypothetical protein [Ignavibacteriota bacterium]